MSSIEKLTFKQLALSLNHQNAGDEKVSYLSIAYIAEDAAGALSEEHIDGYFGKFTYKSWFNINGNVATPMDWTKRVGFKFEEGFKDVPVTMLLKGKKEFEFDGCRLYFDRLRLVGGMILPDFHIHVIEHTDSQLIAIRRAEYSEVVLSLGEGVLIERKARKQRELPLDADPNADKVDDATEGQEGGTTPLNGVHIAEARDETLIWWQHGLTAEKFAGKRCDMPEGCVEIDPPAGCKSEAEQLAKSDGSPADLEDFAAGAARAVGARKKRGSNVIDGRSERVKHQDRLQGRDDTH